MRLIKYRNTIFCIPQPFIKIKFSCFPCSGNKKIRTITIINKCTAQYHMTQMRKRKRAYPVRSH